MTQQTSPRYITITETAKLIRQELKKNFPGIKFSVRSRTNVIDIEWTDGPTSNAVSTACKPFEGATFDGMTDCRLYHTSELNGETVRFGCDWVSCNRIHSPVLVQRVAEVFCQRYGHQVPEILILCSEGYINYSHPLRDEIMPLVYETDAKELDNLRIGIYHGRLAVLHDGMEDDPVITIKKQAHEEAVPVAETAQEPINHVQAIDAAYSHYCDLFNDPTSSIEEQQAAFQTYQDAREAWNASQAAPELREAWTELQTVPAYTYRYADTARLQREIDELRAELDAIEKMLTTCQEAQHLHDEGFVRCPDCHEWIPGDWGEECCYLCHPERAPKGSPVPAGMRP